MECVGGCEVDEEREEEEEEALPELMSWRDDVFFLSLSFSFFSLFLSLLKRQETKGRSCSVHVDSEDMQKKKKKKRRTLLFFFFLSFC